jgi:hypothetical protein
MEAFQLKRADTFQTTFAVGRITNLRLTTEAKFLSACLIACGENDSVAGRRTLSDCLRWHDCSVNQANRILQIAIIDLLQRGQKFELPQQQQTIYFY